MPSTRELRDQVLSEERRLDATDATPPIGGWYSTAVAAVAETHLLNPYTLHRAIADITDKEAGMKIQLTITALTDRDPSNLFTTTQVLTFPLHEAPVAKAISDQCGIAIEQFRAMWPYRGVACPVIIPLDVHVCEINEVTS